MTGPITLDNVKKLPVPEQEQILKKKNTKEEQLIYCQRASGTGIQFVLYCYVGLLLGDRITTGLTKDH